MDRRIRQLAEQVDANQISRREFVRRTAVITGGTAVGLSVLGKMAEAQGPKLRVWLFKSFVTDSNDILAKQVEAWAKERKVQVEMDWATFGDREQKFVAAIEAGNPPDIAEMNASGPDALQAGAPRRVGARQGHRQRPRRPAAARRALRRARRPALRRRPPDVAGRLLHPQGPAGRQGDQAAQGLRSRRRRDGQEDPGSVEGPLGPRPDAQSLGRRQRVHAEHPVELRRRHLGQGRQAGAGHDVPQAEHRGAAVLRRHHPEAQDPAARRDVVDGRPQQRGLHGRQARLHQQRRQPVLRHGRPRSIRSPRRPRSSPRPAGPAGSFLGGRLLQLGHLQGVASTSSCART